MASTRSFILCLAAVAPIGSASAQASLTATASLTVAEIGRVLEESPLVAQGPPSDGWQRLAARVAAAHVGPFVLEARLAEVGGDTVLARHPVTGALVRVTDERWVPVATGPGGRNVVSLVEFLVAIRDSSGLPAGGAPRVTYRVVSRAPSGP